MRQECEATVTVRAPVEAVWRIVADVTRVGEWSGECLKCEWVGPTMEPTTSARFRGFNRRGWIRWKTVNEIDVAEPPREIVWHTISPALYKDSTKWRIALNPTPYGTEVALSFRVLELSRPLEWLIGRIVPAHRDRSADLADDLARLKALVEVAVPSP